MSTKGMYRMPCIVQWDREPPLPDCMYRLSNLHTTTPSADEIVDSVPDVMAQVVRLLQRPSKLIEMLETRQVLLLQQLESLQKQMKSMRENLLASDTAISHITSVTSKKSIMNDLPKDVVVNVSPERIPYSLLAIKKIFNVDITCHTHSSITNLASSVKEFNDRLSNIKISNPSSNITLIWKNVGLYSELVMSSVPMIIHGEVNILRYVVSVLNSSLSYNDNENFWEIDSLLDTCHLLQTDKSATGRSSILKSLSSKLGKNKWFTSASNETIVDLAVWSMIKQLNMQTELTDSMKNWMKRCDKCFDV